MPKSTDIVSKTPEGVQELKSRAHKLAPRLRSMLVMIDGGLNVGQLEEAASRLGAPADFIDTLLAEGLVALKPSAASSASASSAAAHRAVAPAPTLESVEIERFSSTRKFMNDAAVEALGLRAFLFTLKLEKCFNRNDLLALMDEFHNAIVKGSGEETARVLTARARELLG